LYDISFIILPLNSGYPKFPLNSIFSTIILFGIYIAIYYYLSANDPAKNELKRPSGDFFWQDLKEYEARSPATKIPREESIADRSAY